MKQGSRIIKRILARPQACRLTLCRRITRLDLVFLPVPQVMEQGDHSVQRVRAQSWAHLSTWVQVKVQDKVLDNV